MKFSYKMTCCRALLSHALYFKCIVLTADVHISRLPRLARLEVSESGQHLQVRDRFAVEYTAEQPRCCPSLQMAHRASGKNPGKK